MPNEPRAANGEIGGFVMDSRERVYERADMLVRSGLEWLSKHYEAQGSAAYRPLPSPESFIGLVTQVATFLAADDGNDPVEATERCPRCKGGGTHPDHDRGCPGGGPICEAQCPVEVLCEMCRGDGVVPAGSVTQEDDDVPF